ARRRPARFSPRRSTKSATISFSNGRRRPSPPRSNGKYQGVQRATALQVAAAPVGWAKSSAAALPRGQNAQTIPDQAGDRLCPRGGAVHSALCPPYDSLLPFTNLRFSEEQPWMT